MLRLVCTFIHHLSSRWNWEKMVWSRSTCFGVRVPTTLDYPAVNFNPRYSAPYDHNAYTYQTDRQTERQTNKRIAR